MGSITVRFFDKGSQPKSVELPSTKKYIREAMHGNSFDENDFDIYHVNVMGAEFDSLVDDKDMKGFNLLAEKMQLLKNEELDKFRAVLFSKNMFITEKLKTVDAIELCKILDNIDCYKLHTNKQNLTDEQLLNCEKVEYLGFLEKVSEYKNIDNSELYRKYEMPEDNPLFKLSIAEFIGVEDYGEDYFLEFPLRDVVKDDLDTVKSLDENKHFKIMNNYYNDLDLYMDYLVTKQDLLELNEFTNKFINLDRDTQNKFNSLYNMYVECYDKEFENGVPINQLDQVLNDVENYVFLNHKEMRKLVVNAYLTGQGVSRELREYIDCDKLFHEVVTNTEFYETNICDQKYSANFVDKNTYEEYLMEEHELLKKEEEMAEEMAEEMVEENGLVMEVDM